MQNVFKGKKKPLPLVREKEQKMVATDQKSEQMVRTMTQDLKVDPERNKQKLGDSRLTQEKDSIQATLEQSEMDPQQCLNSHLEKQEREIRQLQKRLEHELEQCHLLVRKHDLQLIDAKRQLETQAVVLKKTSNQLSAAQLGESLEKEKRVTKARSTFEDCVVEAREQHNQLEIKLLEAEKEKQKLREESRKVIIEAKHKINQLMAAKDHLQMESRYTTFHTQPIGGKRTSLLKRSLNSTLVAAFGGFQAWPEQDDAGEKMPGKPG
ncbi:hypothetical protein UPYG_G00061990 [Umbra pygmaea]|uniref:Uncharacterized protein n=1 Tax=Umbra pygmaea TaxID=75934 RepID=A0ABD0X9U3_UMBPY